MLLTLLLQPFQNQPLDGGARNRHAVGKVYQAVGNLTKGRACVWIELSACADSHESQSLDYVGFETSSES